MSDVVISVKNVSKSYSVFKSNFAKLLYSLGLRKAKPQELVWALRDINFEIKRGEAVAIIGRNGAGKSSLLEILTGTLKPTEGQVQVNGKVSALLELGSGFDPELTGRENVVLNGLLLGLSKYEVLKRFPEIEAFAEIGDAIDRPIKTYSSGMVMRLAFSVQVLCNPGILIIDEALSVGDFFFQQKCFARLRLMIEEGLTLLFVSHDMSSVNQFCSRAIYLKSGQLACFDRKQIAIKKYLAESDLRVKKVDEKVPKSIAGLEFLNAIPDEISWRRKNYQEAIEMGGILAVSILDKYNVPSRNFAIGSEVRLCVYFARDLLKQSHVFISMKNRWEQIVTTTGTLYAGLSLDEISPKKIGVLELSFPANLEAGMYSFAISMGIPILPNRLGEILDVVPPAQLGPIEICLDYNSQTAPFLGPYGLASSIILSIEGG